MNDKKKEKKGALYALYFVLALVLASMLLSIISFIRQDVSKKQAGNAFNSEKSGKGEVAGRAWVESGDFKPGEPLRCWIRLENLTDGPVTGLRFGIAEVLPHPSTAGPRDLKGQLNRELAAKLPQPPAQGDPTTLGPGHAVSFWTAIHPPAQEDQYEIDLVYRWSKGDQRGENRLLIGPLESLSPEEQWARIGASVYGVGKDLALPIAVAVLTFLFSRWEKDYEQRRQTAEKEREEARQAAEKQRDQARQEAERQRERLLKEAERHTQQIRETWARMLIISRRDTSRFYLPLLATMSLLMRRVEKKDPPGWEREAFFHLMTFFRTMKQLKDENGGIYLKSRKGEDVISGVWGLLIKPAAEERFTPKGYAAAVDEVNLRESFAQFDDNLDEKKRPALTKCWEKFQEWLGEDSLPFDAYVPLLRLFFLALHYEKDRPLDYWYGNAQEPPRKEIEDLLHQLLNKPPLAEQFKASGLEADVREFLQEAEQNYLKFNRSLQRPQETAAGQA